MNEMLNPVELAQQNLKEAERQLHKAQADYASGELTEARLQQLEKLHAACSDDLQRVIREN
ncbi:hypothetical protein [Psychromicrobium lacuslunae]|uniref:Uncharacterized protein n=1 Tax=Psychromicrobium lacuslunae TaxID=1618207 RepID=A0A0D4BXY2_9MICC|nr:hypothetical protein [Psychromicrobium lacuslunae]AJT41178.1 hypothetical protein UM93_05985 [Psychromicrobium lacuslunae]